MTSLLTKIGISAGAVLLLVLYILGLQSDIAELRNAVDVEQDNVAEQKAKVIEWQQSNQAWEQAYFQQRSELDRVKTLAASRQQQYGQSQQATVKQVEEITNAPDPNNVRDVDLGDGYWLPISQRAITYNATKGLSGSAAVTTNPNANTKATNISQ